MTLEYRLLGPLEVEGDEGVIALGGRQQRQLLALLVLHANAPVSGATIVDRLWPDGAPRTAAGAVRVLLSQLRRALAGGAVGPSLLGRSAAGWVLRVDPGQVDAARFEAGVVEGQACLARGDVAGASRQWRAALALWRGPALADVVDDLEEARAAATRWQELRVATLEHCIEAELRLGPQAELTAELEALVAEHPFRERFVGSLMLALYRAGRQTDALRVYAQARHRLVEELGIEPDRSLAELEGAILRHDPGLDMAGAPSVEAPSGEPAPAAPAAPAPAPVPVPAAPPPAVPPPTELLPDALAVAAERGPLLGRGPALARWQEIWAQARRGRAQVVVVSGPAGIGKTRLAAEAARYAHDHGGRVLFGRCDEEALTPYQPLVEALRDHVRHLDVRALAPHLARVPPELVRLVPELQPLAASGGGPPISADERYWLFETIADLLRALAGAAPLALVLDDVQWADGPSLSLLRHLGRRVLDVPLALVMTCRDTDLAGDEPLSALLVDLERQGRLERLPLRGLDVNDAVAMVRRTWPGDRGGPSAAALREACRLAEGNPFFLRQLARHLAEVDTGGPGATAPLPHEVQALLRRRLDRLSEAARRALTSASVIGREFDFDLLQAVLDSGEEQLLDALDEALDARLVVESREGTDCFSFVHALLRETCYGALSASRRARLHARVARALEAAGRPDSLAALAHHFALAGPDYRAEARTYALRAAAPAMAVLAFEEAAELYAHALDAMGPDEPAASRLDVLLALGRARTRAGDPAGARRALSEALALARRAGMGRHFAEAALAYGGEWGIDRDLEEVYIPLLEEAASVVGPADPALMAKVAARLAAATFHLRGADAARPLTERALVLAEKGRDAQALTMAYHAHHLVLLVDGSPAERLARAADQLRQARQAGGEGVNEALWNAVVDLMELGRPAEVDAAVRAYVEQTERSRRPVDLWWMSVFDSAVRAHRGDLAGALQAAEAAAVRGQQLGQVDALRVLSAQVFMVQWLGGGAGELLDATEGYVAQEPDVPAWRCGLALLKAEAGDREGARQVLAPLTGGGLDRTPRDSMWVGTLLLAAEAAGLAGDVELAADLEARLAPLRGRHVALGQAFAVLGPVDRLLGQLAAARGDLATAQAHLEDALEQATAAESPPYRLLAAVALADVLGRRGEAGPAREVLAAATEEAKRLGLGLVVARARVVAEHLAPAVPS